MKLSQIPQRLIQFGITLLGEPVKKETLNNLTVVSVGSLISGLILFIISVVSARIIGPTEYGKYSLVVSTSNFLIIPMLASLHLSITRYFSSDKTTRHYLGTIATIIIILSLLTLSLGILLINPITHFFKISHAIFTISLVFSLFIAQKYFFEGILRGLLRFKKIRSADILSSFVILITAFYLFFIKKDHSYFSYLTAIITGYFSYILLSFTVTKSFFTRPTLRHFPRLKPLLTYSSFGMIGNISFFFIASADKFITNTLLGTKALGLYALYFGISLAVNGQLLTIINTYLFPTASRSGDPNRYKVMQRIVPKIFLALFAIHALLLFGIHLFLGVQYEQNLLFIILMALSATTFITYQLPMVYTNAIGVKGIRHTVITNLIISLFALPGYFLMIKIFGIYGLPIVHITVNSILLISFNRFLNKNQLRQKTIIHITPALDQIGGTEAMLLRTTPELPEYKHVFISIGPMGTMGRDLSKKHAVHSLNLTKLSDIPRSMGQLISIIKKENPFIVMTYLIHADLFGRLGAKLAGNHNVACFNRGSLLNWKYLRFFDFLSKPLVDYYLTNSHTQSRRLRRQLLLLTKKVSVITNGINGTNFKTTKSEQAIKKELGISSNKQVIGYLGRLRGRKGIPDLLRAFKAANLKNTVLVLVGSGELEGALKKLSKNLSLNNRVIFAGKQNNPADYYQIFDLFVFPTYEEGMPNVLIEAMAAKVPIITTNIPECREVVANYATLFEPGDIDGLKTALTSFNKKDAKKNAESAHQRYRQFFTLERTVNKLKSFYSSLYTS